MMSENKTPGRKKIISSGIYFSYLVVLSNEQLKSLNEDYRNDKRNLLAQTTCCQQSLTDVIVDRQTRISSIHVFNTKVPLERERVCLIFIIDYLHLGFIRRSSGNESKSVRSMLDICLFKCYENSIDESIENFRIGIKSKLSFLLR
jgi:hypothetical protein